MCQGSPTDLMNEEWNPHICIWSTPRLELLNSKSILIDFYALVPHSIDWIRNSWHSSPRSPGPENIVKSMGSCAGFGTHVLGGFGCTLYPLWVSISSPQNWVELYQFRILYDPHELYLPEASTWTPHLFVHSFPGRALHHRIIWLEKVSSWFCLEDE